MPSTEPQKEEIFTMGNTVSERIPHSGSLSVGRTRLYLSVALLIGALAVATVSQPGESANGSSPHLRLDVDTQLGQRLDNNPLQVRPIDIVNGLVVSLQANNAVPYNLYGAYLNAGALQRDGFSSPVTAQPGQNGLPYDCSNTSSGFPMPPCTTADDFLRAGSAIGTAYSVYTPNPRFYPNATFSAVGPQRFPQNMMRDLAAASRNGPVLYLAATPSMPALRRQVGSRPLVIAPQSVSLGNGWTVPLRTGPLPIGPHDFSGTWSTDFGTLRLQQIDGYVVGDYADVGVMVGKAKGQCVAGVFTNGGDNGIFRFRVSGKDRFRGQWAWHGDPLRSQWNGTRTSNRAHQFHNFSRNGSMTQSIDNQRTVFDGTYSSNFGEVELVSRDLFLIGDYANLGVIAGMWDGDSFVGRFTNGADTGWFDFAFFSKNGTFRRGSWGWVNGGRQGNWTLNRTSNQTPTIANMLANVSCP